MERRQTKAFGVVAGLFGIWAILWWPLLTQGDVLFARDILFHWVPIKSYWLERISAGEIPWWNPHVSLGIPYFADIGNQTLYPGNIVFLFSGDVLTGISWFVAIHSFLMMLCTARLLHVLGLSAFVCCQFFTEGQSVCCPARRIVGCARNEIGISVGDIQVH